MTPKEETLLKQKGTPHLLIAISVKVLLLNDGAKVEADVVDHIRRVLRQIQQHEVEVQPNHTTDQREPNFNFPLQTQKRKEKKNLERLGLPFPAEIQNQLRVEANRPRRKRDPSYDLVRYF